MEGEMKSPFQRLNASRYCAVIFAIIVLQACAPKYSYRENAMPEPVALSPRLQAIFAKTKLVCFGRYALEVPQEAVLLSGGIAIPVDVEVFPGGVEAQQQRLAEEIRDIKRANRTAEIIYNGVGPMPGSWQVRYFSDEYSKEDNALNFTTYVKNGDLTFIIGDSITEGENEEQVSNRQAALAKSIRLRAVDEVPDEPGFCAEHSFIPESRYATQEMANGGIYLPSLPDIAFSVSSNKNAYGDYSKDAFENEQRSKLSLLARIAAAKADQPGTYPSRTVLREGKRIVQHWHGEESLFKRRDGTHDFEWAFVGTPRDVANPSEFNAVMYTKVEHNTVGAAHAASLSDDEAVALFDKLLSGLKFRVKVPGAPEGSYFLPAKKPTSAAPK
jgi:hypothetical protein